MGADHIEHSSADARHSGNIHHPTAAPQVQQTAQLPKGVLAAGRCAIRSDEEGGNVRLEDSQQLPVAWWRLAFATQHHHAVLFCADTVKHTQL